MEVINLNNITVLQATTQDGRNLYFMLKNISLCLMALFYVIAGINHFLHPGVYLKIMPGFVPWPVATVYITGVLESVSGILLLPSATRRIAAWAIIILLIIVFPANVQMMFNYMREHNDRLWIAILRLPLQVLLIWWGYGFTRQK